jgi:hypothetical protein
MGSTDPLAALDAGPIFVVGAARSGTTWVHDALRIHPLVGAVFETELFQLNTGMGGLFDPARWEGDPQGVARIISRADLLAEGRAFAGRVLAHGLQPHHRYLVEKTPGHVERMPIIAAAFPEARFIHVIRDGRDVCVSRRAAQRTWARSWKRLPGRLEVARIAASWSRLVRAGQAGAAALGDRVLEVRYEELRRDPRAGYRRMLDFATIPYDDELIETIHAGVDFDTTGRAKDPTGFYRAGRVGDWQHELGLTDCIAFDAVAGATLVDLGYEARRGWWLRSGRLRAQRARARRA